MAAALAPVAAGEAINVAVAAAGSVTGQQQPARFGRLR